VRFSLNLVNWAFEFQADSFVKNIGHGTPLREGLIKLHKENLSTMNIDTWYSAYHYSHPPLVERLAALDRYDEKEE
jgi:STE24 endopeptidase